MLKSSPKVSPSLIRGQSQAASGPLEQLTQRAYLTAIASLLEYATTLAVAFVVTPILVAGLGNSFYGVWQILQRLVNYMSAADGRPTQALKWVVAHRQASDDHAAMRRAVGSAAAIWLLFLPIVVLAGMVVVWLSPSITKVPPSAYLVVRITCALLVINFVLTSLVGLPEIVLRGMNLGYKRMGLVPGLTILGGICSAAAVYLGFGLVGVGFSQLVVAPPSILTGVLFWMITRKYVPWFGIARPTMEEVRHFFRFSGWFFAWTLVNQLIMASDLVILGYFASATAVTIFAITSFPAQTAVELLAIVVGSITPGLGGMIGQKQYEKAATIRGEMMIYSWLLVTAIGTTILLWNRSFIHLWVGPNHYAGAQANLLIMLITVQLIFIRNDAFVIDLTLDLRRKVTIGVVGALLSIGFAVLLIPHLGIVGLCFGLLAGRGILTVTYPLIVNSSLRASLRAQMGSLLRPIMVMCILFGGASYMSQQLLVSHWLLWVAYTAISFGLALSIASLAGLSGRQRKQLIRRVRSIHFFAGA